MNKKTILLIISAIILFSLLTSCGEVDNANQVNNPNQVNNNNNNNNNGNILVEDLSSFTEDHRSYQHGIDFVKQSNGGYILIWASSGLAPIGPDSDGEWSHDVYYSTIDITAPKVNPVKIINAPGAQEPASAAISSEGNIIITMEDSYLAENGLAQTYAIYDQNMNPVKEYQNVVFDGGHSGHVASVGNNFVVFYSDEWINGGGVDNLGSGDDVLLKTYDSNGNLLNPKDVSVGNSTRDWWPMITGSNNHALLLWQRFVDGETYAKLMYRIFNPSNNSWVTQEVEIASELKYYTYDAQYISSIDRFLISGTYNNGKGFSYLLSTGGDIVAENPSLPPIVREAQPAILQISNSQAKIVYPTSPHGLVVLSIENSEIILENEVLINFQWPYSGTDGIFLDNNTVYFASLYPSGIKELTIDLD